MYIDIFGHLALILYLPRPHTAHDERQEYLYHVIEGPYSRYRRTPPRTLPHVHGNFLYSETVFPQDDDRFGLRIIHRVVAGKKFYRLPIVRPETGCIVRDSL